MECITSLMHVSLASQSVPIETIMGFHALFITLMLAGRWCYVNAMNRALIIYEKASPAEYKELGRWLPRSGRGPSFWSSTTRGIPLLPFLWISWAIPLFLLFFPFLLAETPTSTAMIYAIVFFPCAMMIIFNGMRSGFLPILTPLLVACGATFWFSLSIETCDDENGIIFIPAIFVAAATLSSLVPMCRAVYAYEK
jgi:hypothetical protein